MSMDGISFGQFEITCDTSPLRIEKDCEYVVHTLIQVDYGGAPYAMIILGTHQQIIDQVTEPIGTFLSLDDETAFILQPCKILSPMEVGIALKEDIREMDGTALEEVHQANQDYIDQHQEGGDSS